MTPISVMKSSTRWREVTSHWRCVRQIFSSPPPGGPLTSRSKPSMHKKGFFAKRISSFISGKLSLEDYSSYLRTASVGISLMVSPHPSYPPLEMAEAGIVTITNSCFGKNLGRVANNIISLDRVAEDTIAEAIASAIPRSNVSPKPWAGRDSGLGSFVESLPNSPNSLDVRGRGRGCSTACSAGRSHV
jgi:hypothetical protein